MAEVQVQASEGVPSPAEANSSAFSPPSDDTISPPAAAAAAALAHDANTPPSETSTSISDSHFCAYAICVNHNHINNDPNSTNSSSSSQPTPPSKPCPKCHTVTYCSRPCQKADWKSHKKSCAANAQQRLLETDNVPTVQRQGGRKVPARDRGQGERLRKWQFDT